MVCTNGDVNAVNKFFNNSNELSNYYHSCIDKIDGNQRYDTWSYQQFSGTQ